MEQLVITEALNRVTDMPNQTVTTNRAIITSKIKHQIGISMISLMIGMLVSAIGVLSMTSMHKSLIQVSVQSQSDARHDSQLAFALMQLQVALQNAGYGIENAGPETAKLINYDGEPALVWRTQSNTVTECLGFVEHAFIDTKTNMAGRQLTAIEATANCTIDAELQNLTWEPHHTAAYFRNQNQSIIDFQVNAANCSPYGFGPAIDHLLVTITVQSSADLANANTTPIQYQHCLANIYI